MKDWRRSGESRFSSSTKSFFWKSWIFGIHLFEFWHGLAVYFSHFFFENDSLCRERNHKRTYITAEPLLDRHWHKLLIGNTKIYHFATWKNNIFRELAFHFFLVVSMQWHVRPGDCSSEVFRRRGCKKRFLPRVEFSLFWVLNLFCRIENSRQPDSERRTW